MNPLYKYVGSESAVRAIATGSLKFTKIADLNDPAELVPQMSREAVGASLQIIREAGYTQEQFEWLGCQEALLRLLSPETRVLSRPATISQSNQTLMLPVYDNLDFMERQLTATISLIRSRVGILSLTERLDSLPMWAHYAVQARGYVVSFEGLDKEFTGNTTGSLNSLKPVTYLDDLVGMTHDPATQDNLFFCKFKDWSYEREWRVVSALSECTNSDGEMPLRTISSAAVTGVICGWNVPIENVRSLATDLAGINPSLRVDVAVLDRGRVHVNAWQ